MILYLLVRKAVTLEIVILDKAHHLAVQLQKPVQVH